MVRERQLGIFKSNTLCVVWQQNISSAFVGAEEGAKTPSAELHTVVIY